MFKAAVLVTLLVMSASGTAGAHTPPSQTSGADDDTSNTASDNSAPGAMTGYVPRPPPIKPLNAPSGYTSRSRTYSATGMQGYLGAGHKSQQVLAPTYASRAAPSNDLKMPNAEKKAKAKALLVVVTKYDAHGVLWTFVPSTKMWKNALTGQQTFQTPH